MAGIFGGALALGLDLGFGLGLGFGWLWVALDSLGVAKVILRDPFS